MHTHTDLGIMEAEDPPERVLLISGHEQQRETIESALRGAGFEVSIATDRRSALKVVNEKQPQIVIVDSALPEIGGMLESIRKDMDTQEISIISLSEPDSRTDIAQVPAISADAVVQTPVVMELLLSKIAELQKRLPATDGRRVLTAGAIKMFPEQWLVYVDDKNVNLTEKEFRLLLELMEARGRVLTREMLLERVWGYRRALDLETRTLDVHMSRLRSKLGSAASNIITVRSVGYRMNVVPEWLNH